MMTEYIEQIIEAVKALPVDCSKFETADAWVGLVLALTRLKAQLAEPEAVPAEEDDNG